MQIPLFALIILLILLFLLIPAFRLRSRLIEKETFVAIDGSTFWSSRWGKVKVDGLVSPQEGEPEYEEAKRLLSEMLKSKPIAIIPLRKDRKEGIVAKVIVRGEDLAEKIRERIKGP
ncbi:MAG: hypothetical protein OEW43_01185 [Elusimicrobiota bacterium]|nr:hypothetical protein [Elusimicrobiota bacterium]